MSTKHLTAKSVEQLKPPATGQVDYFDAGYPGLALRLSYAGTRTWTYFYRWRGKQKRLTLGPLDLAEARDAWRDAREKLARGVEPTTRTTVESPDNFEAVVNDWLKRDQSENRSGEGERYMRKHAIPAWGSLKIGDIGRRQVMDLIDGIADRGKLTAARRCHAALHRLFRWSVGRGIIEANPMADLPKPGSETKRTRALTDAELVLAWNAAADLGYPMGTAVQLLILTGCRREEIGELQRREIIWERKEIHLEGDRTKNGEPRDIPLVESALKLLKEAPRIGKSKFVFTTTGNTPVSGWSRAKTGIDKRMLESARKAAQKRGEDPDEVSIAPWRIHDIRRTIATGMERLGVNLQVVEALLGHISGSKAGVVGIYQQHDYAVEKREAIEKWAEHIASLLRRAQ